MYEDGVIIIMLIIFVIITTSITISSATTTIMIMNTITIFISIITIVILRRIWPFLKWASRWILLESRMKPFLDWVHSIPGTLGGLFFMNLLDVYFPTSQATITPIKTSSFGGQILINQVLLGISYGLISLQAIHGPFFLGSGPKNPWRKVRTCNSTAQL